MRFRSILGRTCATADCTAAFALVSFLSIALTGCKPSASPPASSSSDGRPDYMKGSVPVTESPTNQSTLIQSPFQRAREEMANSSTLAKALEISRPFMEDTNEGHLSDGSALLGIWAIHNMRWSDVAIRRNQTTWKRVQKDSEAERGKLLCVRGFIVQIEVERLGQDRNSKIYHGLLIDLERQLFNFHAVGSSGDLVSRSVARFCGVVTSNFNYSNSAGGTGHAVDLVGMFDLRENKRSFQPPALHDASIGAR